MHLMYTISHFALVFPVVSKLAGICCLDVSSRRAHEENIPELYYVQHGFSVASVQMAAWLAIKSFAHTLSLEGLVGLL